MPIFWMAGTPIPIQESDGFSVCMTGPGLKDPYSVRSGIWQPPGLNENVISRGMYKELIQYLLEGGKPWHIKIFRLKRLGKLGF